MEKYEEDSGGTSGSGVESAEASLLRKWVRGEAQKEASWAGGRRPKDTAWPR